MDSKEIMKRCKEEANWTMKRGMGGPFGAAIIKDGEMISLASNVVLKDNDPTAHAEITAIRLAGKVLKTHDLSGCELYTTAQPCPMCLSAAIWANIKKIHYGCSAADADNIGFRDKFIYDFIEGKCEDTSVLELEQVERESCLELFQEYHENKRQMY